MFAGLQGENAQDAADNDLLRIAARFGVELNTDNAVSDPERAGAFYLTVSMDERADEFVTALRGIDGVLSAFAKPEAALP